MTGWKGQTDFTWPGGTGFRVTLFPAASGIIFWSLQGSEFSGREFFRGIPQVLPQMVAHLAIRFEMNLRDSTILGLVGLGFYVFLYVKQFQWEKTGVLCLAIILLVFAGEFVSWQIRKRLL